MSASTITDQLRAPWPALLVLTVVVLLPVAASAEAPLIIASAAGLWIAWRERARLSAHRGARIAFALFACYWVAELISTPGAIAPARSWSTVAATLRFLPFALFAVLALRDAAQWPRIERAVAMIVTLWLLDAWAQIFTGFSIAGPMEKERLSGIFGADNLKLGPVLAVLSPFVLNVARARFGTRGLIVAGVFLLMPILLSGSRASWLMYALVAGVFLWQQTRTPARFAAWAFAAIAVAGAAAVVADRDSERFDARVQRTLLVLHGSMADLDAASAGRVRIWTTALRMTAAHPLAGVGVRGFRYAYAQYAQPGDAFVDPKTNAGAFHAHSLVLEVLSETGIIGLLLWIAGAGLAIRAWRRADAQARDRAFAPGLGLAVMCFPLNTQLSFYATSAWSLLFWLLLALYCAALAADRDDGA